eukprot:Pgem_evm1s19551
MFVTLSSTYTPLLAGLTFSLFSKVESHGTLTTPGVHGARSNRDPLGSTSYEAVVKGFTRKEGYGPSMHYEQPDKNIDYKLFAEDLIKSPYKGDLKKIIEGQNKNWINQHINWGTQDATDNLQFDMIWNHVGPCSFYLNHDGNLEKILHHDNCLEFAKEFPKGEGHAYVYMGHILADRCSSREDGCMLEWHWLTLHDFQAQYYKNGVKIRGKNPENRPSELPSIGDTVEFIAHDQAHCVEHDDKSINMEFKNMKMSNKECEKYCIEEANCVAFEAQKGKNHCQIVIGDGNDHPRVRNYGPKYTTAYDFYCNFKRDVKATEKMEIDEFKTYDRAHCVDPENVDSIEMSKETMNLNNEQCEAHCRDEPKCVAFQIEKGKNNCIITLGDGKYYPSIKKYSLRSEEPWDFECKLKSNLVKAVETPVAPVVPVVPDNNTPNDEGKDDSKGTGQGVTVFSSCTNANGTGKLLKIGSYTQNQVSAMAMLSFTVPTGHVVIMYNEDNFKGKFTVITENTCYKNQLTQGNNAMIKSMIIAYY